jgi:hypothetical protein
MAQFVPNKPVASTEPSIVAENVPEGVHLFQLTVEDNLGQVSEPVTLTVNVFRVITQAQEPDKP